MTVTRSREDCAGFEGQGRIEIKYTFRNGRQGVRLLSVWFLVLHFYHCPVVSLRIMFCAIKATKVFF